MRSQTRLGVLVSGTGRSLANLLQVIGRGELAATVSLVVSDRPGVRALEIADAADVPHAVVERRRCGGTAAFSQAIFALLEEHRVDLAVLAGFLRRIDLPSAWRGRVINIHPSLLPKYGGKGFYGDRVHAAVLAAGEPTTGCTVHFVDDTYDTGPPILRREIAVHPDDTVETLAARVFSEECIALPEAIRRVRSGQASPGGSAR